MGNRPSVGKTVHNDAGNGLKVGTAEMKGWRDTMEDACKCCLALPGKPDCSLLAVFDGHGGDAISKACSDKVLNVLESLPNYHQTESIEDWKQLCYDLFVELDRQLKENLFREGTRTGATAAIVIITPSAIISASAGDSRSVLATENEGHICLSSDHKPTHEEETRRIEAAGGAVLLGRVNGELAVSRAFGDFCYKDRDDLRLDEQAVTAAPYILTHERNGQEQALVIACDGIWDVMDNETVANFVRTRLEKGRRNLGRLCGHLLDHCLNEGSRDNMTAIVVAFEDYIRNLQNTDEDSPPPSPCPHNFNEFQSDEDDSEENSDDGARDTPPATDGSGGPGQDRDGRTPMENTDNLRVQMNDASFSDDDKVPDFEEVLRKDEQEWNSFRSGQHESLSRDSDCSRSSGGPEAAEENLWQNGGHHLSSGHQNEHYQQGIFSSERINGGIKAGFTSQLPNSQTLHQGGGQNSDWSNFANGNSFVRSSSKAEGRRRAEDRFRTRLQEIIDSEESRRRTYRSGEDNTREEYIQSQPKVRHTGREYAVEDYTEGTFLRSQNTRENPPPKNGMADTTFQPRNKEKANVNGSLDVEFGANNRTQQPFETFYSPIPVIKVNADNKTIATDRKIKSRSKSTQKRNKNPPESRREVENPQREVSRRSKSKRRSRRAVSSTPQSRQTRERKMKSKYFSSSRTAKTKPSSARNSFLQDTAPAEPTWISRFLHDNVGDTTRNVTSYNQNIRPRKVTKAAPVRSASNRRFDDGNTQTKQPVRAGGAHETSFSSRVSGNNKPHSRLQKHAAAPSSRSRCKSKQSTLRENNCVEKQNGNTHIRQQRSSRTPRKRTKSKRSQQRVAIDDVLLYPI